jgi:hypothetical protein
MCIKNASPGEFSYLATPSYLQKLLIKKHPDSTRAATLATPVKPEGISGRHKRDIKVGVQIDRPEGH